MKVCEKKWLKSRKVETEGVSVVEAPFYEILKSALPIEDEKDWKNKELSHDTHSEKKPQINNFWNKPAEQRLISGRIEDEIYYSRINGLTGKAAELTTELFEVG